jgi:hypothetical protein
MRARALRYALSVDARPLRIGSWPMRVRLHDAAIRPTSSDYCILKCAVNGVSTSAHCTFRTSETSKDELGRRSGFW